MINPDKEKKKLPHYDKMSGITADEAKVEYSYVWDKLGELIPHLTTEEKRRVIELVANTCKHCFQNETPCTCWKDE